ncbi:MAG: tail fiber assembly protein [Pseudomonas sp.]|nr:tail fiber assembly protein [Pseudomonas sp.]
MSGYAVSIDLSYSRLVQGPRPEEGDPEGSTYPDYAVETYLPFDQGPPPDPVRRALTDEEAIEAAAVEINSLLTVAALRIAPLQDSVDVGKSTPEKAALLKKWKEYRIDVDDVKTQSGYPHAIKWPEQPA